MHFVQQFESTHEILARTLPHRFEWSRLCPGPASRIAHRTLRTTSCTVYSCFRRCRCAPTRPARCCPQAGNGDSEGTRTIVLHLLTLTWRDDLHRKVCALRRHLLHVALALIILLLHLVPALRQVPIIQGLSSSFLISSHHSTASPALTAFRTIMPSNGMCVFSATRPVLLRVATH